MRKHRLFRFENNLGSFPLPRPKNNRALRRGESRARTAAMRVTREAEFAPAKPAPQQRRGSRGHDHQRNNLLPIHKEKDNLETTARNGEFWSPLGLGDYQSFLPCMRQKTVASPKPDAISAAKVFSGFNATVMIPTAISAQRGKPLRRSTVSKIRIGSICPFLWAPSNSQAKEWVGVYVSLTQTIKA